ncbi:hypothetical protein Tco_1289785 [Tanacetum coccineum]
MGAEMDHKEPGFELKWLKMGQNGSKCFVRLGFGSWGFRASILHLYSTSRDSWEFLDQRFAAIDGYRRRNDDVNAVLGGLGMTWEVYGGS